MDWTLLIDRQAANCRNTSDEVFPRIYLGDRYGKYSYHLTLKSFRNSKARKTNSKSYFATAKVLNYLALTFVRPHNKKSTN